MYIANEKINEAMFVEQFNCVKNAFFFNTITNQHVIIIFSVEENEKAVTTL